MHVLKYVSCVPVFALSCFCHPSLLIRVYYYLCEADCWHHHRLVLSKISGNFLAPILLRALPGAFVGDVAELQSVTGAAPWLRSITLLPILWDTMDTLILAQEVSSIGVALAAPNSSKSGISGTRISSHSRVSVGGGLGLNHLRHGGLFALPPRSKRRGTTSTSNSSAGAGVGVFAMQATSTEPKSAVVRSADTAGAVSPTFTFSSYKSIFGGLSFTANFKSVSLSRRKNVQQPPWCAPQPGVEALVRTEGFCLGCIFLNFVWILGSTSSEQISGIEVVFWTVDGNFSVTCMDLLE